ncbi:Hypothetical predicted protein, partial [Pelobates cultripes]
MRRMITILSFFTSCMNGERNILDRSKSATGRMCHLHSRESFKADSLYHTMHDSFLSEGDGLFLDTHGSPIFDPRTI